MPLKFERAVKTVAGFNSEDATLAVWYLDEFGQPRYFEFRNNVPAGWVDSTAFGKELIQQVNGLLARPRPSETHCRVREPRLLPDDIECINGVPTVR